MQLKGKGARAFSKERGHCGLTLPSLPPSLLPGLRPPVPPRVQRQQAEPEPITPGCSEGRGVRRLSKGRNTVAILFRAGPHHLRDAGRGHRPRWSAHFRRRRALCLAPGPAFHSVRSKMAAPMVRCGVLLARRISASRLCLAGWWLLPWSFSSIRPLSTLFIEWSDGLPGRA